MPASDVAETYIEAFLALGDDLDPLAVLVEAPRFGVHVERGPETVGHMMGLYAGHDMVRRDQLMRIRDTLSGSLG